MSRDGADFVGSRPGSSVPRAGDASSTSTSRPDEPTARGNPDADAMLDRSESASPDVAEGLVFVKLPGAVVARKQASKPFVTALGMGL